jgi:hypothetical protein
VPAVAVSKLGGDVRLWSDVDAIATAAGAISEFDAANLTIGL